MSDKSAPGRAAAAILLGSSLVAQPQLTVDHSRAIGLHAPEQADQLHIPHQELPDAIRQLIVAQIAFGAMGAPGFGATSACVTLTDAPRATG